MIKHDEKKAAHVTSSGVSFGGLLTVAFIVLKLTGVISWSWFWVVSPILIPFSIGLVLLVIASIIIGICEIAKS